ncbi:MAG: tRNA 2-thiouridine(34) synthase MnmA [bacterium]|nr:tRNA 2-thiouridine(34) synthase MnmA [bacterium]
MAEIQTNGKPLVAVAMSGGVDSSVSAALLQKKGEFQVVGLYMKNTPNFSEDFLKDCGWHNDRRDAMHVANNQIGIGFEMLDFSREYEEKVFQPMLAEYRAGRTPNPDVWCNRNIKFGVFKERVMRELGAEKIATGHYARISKDEQGYHLLKARDASKDQSYFLWTLIQDDLLHLLFPVGDYIKETEVREMARQFGLATADKKDSQDLCMVGSLDFKSLLKEFIKEPHRGSAIHVDTGAVLGKHDGLEFYTIGERSGFGDGKGALYVARKDMVSGDMFVAPEGHSVLFAGSANIASVNWISGAEPEMPFSCDAVVRYHAKPVAAKVTKAAKDAHSVQFAEPQYAVTSGQSLVLYWGDELIGGGVIQ